MSFEDLPHEIWLKILHYLDYPKRLEVELVSQQFCLISKQTWTDQKKVDIDHRVFNSSAKVSLLLNRCGPYLEELTTHTCLPQSFGDELLLGQICPNLKSITFHRSSTFWLTNVPEGISAGDIQTETDRLLMSFSKLKRLVFASRSGIPWKDYGLLRSLAKIPNLMELHDFIGVVGPQDIYNLQQLQVLSVTSCSLDWFTSGVCRLTHLRQLFIQLDLSDVQIAAAICHNLPLLESLVIDTNACQLDYNLIVPMLIERLPLLNTLVLANRGGIYRRPKINLRPYRNRPVRLNLFVDDRLRYVFVGSSAQVHFVPTVTCNRRGDTVTFLSLFNQNGFDFNSHSTLRVMLNCNETAERDDKRL